MAEENVRERFSGFVDHMKRKSEQEEPEPEPHFNSQADRIVVEEITEAIRKKIQTGKLLKK